jgi:1-aminocyclopropane-1-carboxylate deaminase
MISDLSQWLDPYFSTRSRVHPLNREFETARLFIKREDELSSGISGSKYRKYASLLPFFRHEAFDEIVLIGSAQSNNVVAGLQLLNENGIKSKLILLESNEPDLKGNLLWIYLLYDKDNITWVSRDQWPSVLEIADAYKKEQEESGKKAFILPEGGAVAQALPGAMTLAIDILEDEQRMALQFDHICIDSGSGTSAIGLILGLSNEMNRHLHVTLIAGTEEEFLAQFRRLVSEFNETYASNFSTNVPAWVKFYKPVSAPAFGSITTSILQETRNIARNEGLLMDPVYSVKHLMTVTKLIEDSNLEGNVLFIYNGGSFGLSGFQQKLANTVNTRPDTFEII